MSTTNQAVKHVTVIGGGLMGAGIAQVLLIFGFVVCSLDLGLVYKIMISDMSTRYNLILLIICRSCITIIVCCLVYYNAFICHLQT